MDSIDVINAQIEAAKAKAAKDKREREREFKRRLKQEQAKKRIATAGPVNHEEKWKGVYVRESAIERKFAPLGSSDPSLNKLEWTRFDYKPTVPWKAVTSGRVFSIPPSDEDFLISSGLGTVQNKSTTLAATASPIKKPQDSLAETAVKHPQPWRASDSVSRLFSNIPPDRPMTFHEKKLAIAAKRPDRLRFRPTSDQPAWKPTEQNASLFSRYMTDEEFEKMQAEKEDIMEEEFNGIENMGPEDTMM